MLSDLIRDLRYALRMLAAAPTFTAVVVITLALGVGANALIFTAVDAILLRSPGLADPGRLVSVYNAGTNGQTGQSIFSTVSFPDYADVRDSGIFQDAAAYGGISVSLDSGAETESIAGELVTGNYFQVLGVAPAYGRAFAAEEDRRGVPVHVAVVSYAFWQNRLGASPAAIGREINLNGSPYVVIGVAPPRFVGARLGRAPDVWLPMALQQEVRPPSAGLRRSLGSADLLSARGPRWLSIVAEAQTGEHRGPAHRGARRARAASAGCLSSNQPGPRLQHGRARRRTGRADFDAAHALPARGGGRAGAPDCVCQRHQPAGGTLGFTAARDGGQGGGRRQPRAAGAPVADRIGAAGAARRPLRAAAGAVGRAAAPPRRDSCRRLHLDVNRRVLALHLRRGRGERHPVRPGARSSHAAQRHDHGASRRRRLGRHRHPRGALAARVRGLPGGGEPDAARRRRPVPAHASERLRHRPRLPTSIRRWWPTSIWMCAGTARKPAGGLPADPRAAAGGPRRRRRRRGAGHGAERRRPHRLDQSRWPAHSRGWRQRSRRPHERHQRRLSAMRSAFRSLRGRDFTRRRWPRIGAGGDRQPSPWRRGCGPASSRSAEPSATAKTPPSVVGVVPDTVYVSALERNPPPFFYVPLAQNYESGVATARARTNGDPLALLPAIRAAVHDVDPRIAVARPQRLRDVFEQSIASQRMMATLVGVFGALALLLATVGVYGDHGARRRPATSRNRHPPGARRRAIVDLRLDPGRRPAPGRRSAPPSA